MRVLRASTSTRTALGRGRPSARGPITPKRVQIGNTFDRLLVAQALVEDVPVISTDNTFEQYGVNRIW